MTYHLNIGVYVYMLLFVITYVWFDVYKSIT